MAGDLLEFPLDASAREAKLLRAYLCAGEKLKRAISQSVLAHYPKDTFRRWRELAGLDRGGRSEKRIAAREAGAGKALDMALSSCPSLLHDVLCCFFSGASDDPSRYRSVNREFVVAMTARGQVDAEQRPDGDRAIAREVLEALRPLYAADEFALYVAAVQAVVPDWFKDRNSPTRHAPTRPSPTGASAESAPAARAVSPASLGSPAKPADAPLDSPPTCAQSAGPAHSEEPPAHPEEPAAPVVRQRLDRLAQDLKRVAVDARTAADGMQAGVPPPRPLAWIPTLAERPNTTAAHHAAQGAVAGFSFR